MSNLKTSLALWLAFLLMLTSCNFDAEEESITIETPNIFDPIGLTFEGAPAKDQHFILEEYVKTTSPISYTIEITNNSGYPLKNLSLSFEDPLISEYDFAKDQDSPKGVSPGFGGTCQDELPTKSSCTFVISFFSTKSDLFKQSIIIEYNNLADSAFDKFSLEKLSGTAASLVFKSEQTIYKIGNQVGLAQIPVVERSEKTDYITEMTVVNAGELSARNIIQSLNQSCRSDFDATCTDELNTAFRYESTCPNRIYPGQECNIVVTYSPTNQNSILGPSEEYLEYITFNAVMGLNYESDPLNTTASLNAFYNSIATSVQAKFETSLEEDQFSPPIIHGNRQTKTFKINNKGVRSGFIRNLILKNDSDNIEFICLRDLSTDEYLTCYDENLENQSTALGLPFFIKDSDHCIVEEGSPEKLIPVDSGCLFDITFQPSLELDASTDFQYQLFVEYDALFKGAETIKENKLHNISASSQLPAILTIDQMQLYDSKIENRTELDATTSLFDYGRMTLISPNYSDGAETAFTIIIKNEGDTQALDLQFSDGSGVIIPNVAQNPLGVNLGTHTPSYYKNTSASSSCINLSPGATCVISASFNPIALETNTQEDENMYDDIVNQIKSFNLTYNDQTKYNDLNLTSEEKETPLRSLQARLKADLVTRGSLQNLTISNSIFSQPPGKFSGNQNLAYFLVRNIGTGPIPYIGVNNSTDDSGMTLEGNTVTYVATDPSLLSSNNAQHDCIDIIDFESNVSPIADADDFSSISARSSNWSPLPKEEACMLTLKYLQDNKSLTSTPQFSSSDSITYDPNLYRDFTIANQDQVEQYKYARTYLNPTASLFYHDGDTSDPTSSTQHLGEYFGNRTFPSVFNYRFLYSPTHRVVLSDISPKASAIAYTPEVRYPELSYIDHTTGNTIVKNESFEIPERYNYGLNFSLYEEEVEPIFSPLIYSSFYSYNHVPDIISPYKGVHEHIIHFGTFPNSEDISLALELSNIGHNPRVKKIDLSSSSDLEFTLTSQGITDGSPIESLGESGPLYSRNISLLFNALSPGTYSAELEIEYYNKLFLNRISGDEQIVSKKILLLVEVVSDTKLIAQYQDYDVDIFENTAPTQVIQETLNDIQLSFNQDSSKQTLTFTYAKSEEITPNSGYAKKRIWIKNSASNPIKDFSLFLKTDPNSQALKSLNGLTSDSNGISIDSSDCSDNIAQLNPQNSFSPQGTSSEDRCYIEITYQPTFNHASLSYLLILKYTLQDNQYIDTHFNMSFIPVDPATLVARDLASKIIAHPETSRSSYALNIGTVYMTEESIQKTFDDILITNTEEARASFLKTYQDYLTENELNGFSPSSPAPKTQEPALDDFTSSGSKSYTRMYLSTYSDGSEKVIVEGSPECFWGTDTEELDSFRKGFSSLDTYKCSINIIFNINLSYIAKHLVSTDQEIMGENSFRLGYFNNLRLSYNVIGFHFEGVVYPDISRKIDTFQDVRANSNGEVQFKIEGANANSLSVGDIVGYRIIYSSVSNDLNGPLFKEPTNYIDIPYDDLDIYISGFNRNYLYYFSVLAIRENSNYSNTSDILSFQGLLSGQYLSETNFSKLKLLIPPLNSYYFHDEKILLENYLTNDESLLTYEAALNQCSSRPFYTPSVGGSLTPLPYELIDEEVWDNIIELDDSLQYSDYGESDPFSYPHWLQSNSYQIDTVFNTVVGYDSSATTQDFPTEKLFYLRDDGCPTCSVKRAVGQYPTTPYYGYDNYVRPDFSFGFARCFVDLSSL